MTIYTHGTHGGYAEGCRCDECTYAHRIYCADRRAARRLVGVPSDAPHGSWSTYTNWSCRCDECKAEAVRVNRRKYTNRKENA